MIINKSLNFIKEILFFFIIIFLGYSILLEPSISSQGALNGLKFCSDILIPSLFPFMVLSTFIIYSGIISKLGIFFDFFTNFIFYLPGESMLAIILSLIGGYPTGAKIIKDLYKEKIINKSQLENMIIFCFGAGPAFIIGIVGTCFFKSKIIGVLIFISQTISSLIIGIIIGIVERIKKSTKKTDIFNEKNTKKIKINKEKKYSDAFISSCENSSMIIINMCAIIIIMNVIISFINHFGISNKILNLILIFKKNNINNMLELQKYEKNISLFLTFFLEITQGCIVCSKSLLSPIVMSSGISWGGICTHLQVKSILYDFNLPYLKFIFFRIIHTIFSSYFIYFLLKYFKISIPIFFYSQDVIPGISSNIFGSTALIFTCVYFLMSIN